MFRKVIVLLLITIFACSMNIPAKASISKDTFDIGLPGDISPSWVMIKTVTNGLDISSNGNASMVSRISTYNDVDIIQISAHLQRYEKDSWVTVKNWTETYEGSSSALWSKSWYVNKGYSYRLMTYFYVAKGSSDEGTILISGVKHY
ncbi:MAG: hypothetical protein AB1420_10180 [Bacillota bacterium]